MNENPPEQRVLLFLREIIIPEDSGLPVTKQVKLRTVKDEKSKHKARP